MLPLFYVISHYFNLPFRAWEQRKLGEIANSFEYGLNASSKTYDGENKYIRITDIDESSHVFNQDNLTSPDISLDNLNHYLLEEGDILLARTGASTGKSYCYNKIDGKVFFAGFLIRAKIKHEYNVSFIFQSTLTERYNNFIQVTSQRSGQPGINAQEYARFALYIPKLKEQQKIGDFFKQLDNTIALHQRKLDALKLMKKGFLQQMFPKRGENIPKIRFDDFDDIWEQRILGEFLKESKIKGSNGSLAKKLTVKLWRKGVVPKEEIYTGSSATQYYIRKTGQFMYGKLDFLNQAFGIVPLELDGYESTLDSPAFDIEESINETFLLEYVSLVRFYKYQGNIANGSRRAKRIHTDTFFEMPIPLPNSNEQQKIGTFSQQIDDLIAFQQNKLEKLSSLKKSYLQNMFI
ncbi:restriction endonuclease subunit S [Listeria monocytogenes]|uniref:restriction endonuclease subunit S n=3 Tax=Listeria monocytogenes TaxID=1639 RepID=UPI000BDF052F|nr:restriction endonuclease subunit S [Listeria monocytogenes]EAK8940689.1 restriction endonuclease subunit S [Listeria monocytogenes]PCW74561.1 type I restriction endonuclease subunit S [Listeria monocytogenes]PCX95305.1 type I restriction endonuclease subunit S [Listeria monocytogenes]PCX97090.1 type I restriction endonuclease subunit S [Listeria monocytogenes]QKI94649.1 restriction endonuclease subunit S [Listeria monocytogenes]